MRAVRTRRGQGADELSARSGGRAFRPAALVFLTMTTKPTFRTDFKPGEGGKIWGAAVYMARWINTRREGAVVGDCDGDGGGLKECREGCG